VYNSYKRSLANLLTSFSIAAVLSHQLHAPEIAEKHLEIALVRKE